MPYSGMSERIMSGGNNPRNYSGLIAKRQEQIAAQLKESALNRSRELGVEYVAPTGNTLNAAMAEGFYGSTYDEADEVILCSCKVPDCPFEHRR